MMKKPWLAAVGNFFFAGLGTLHNGRRKTVGIALTLGAILLTYVEFSIQKPLPQLWGTMFTAVFIINTALAYDGYQEAKQINHLENKQ
ncbi:hypothetical protein [Candidatus Leptofilum sp.]|uniref:hypothetical protein n=1 Tax=Candidatus Leptofilum sp. TaxID=3241576 RepID=UPI003B5B1CA6